MIVNLGGNKVDNNDKSYPQIPHLHNSLLIIIVDNPENNLSNVERKSDARKVRTSLVKSSSTIYFHVQYVQCIIELIMIKNNISH